MIQKVMLDDLVRFFLGLYKHKASGEKIQKLTEAERADLLKWFIGLLLFFVVLGLILIF